MAVTTNNSNKIDTIFGAIGGYVAYKMTKSIINNYILTNTERKGLITKFGCFMVELLIGDHVGYVIKRTVQNYRVYITNILNEKEDVYEVNDISKTVSKVIEDAVGKQAAAIDDAISKQAAFDISKGMERAAKEGAESFVNSRLFIDINEKREV